MGAAAKVGFPGRGTWLNRMVERGTGPPAEVWALTGAAIGCLKTACAYGSDAPSPACINTRQHMLEAQCLRFAKPAACKDFYKVLWGGEDDSWDGPSPLRMECYKAAEHSAAQERYLRGLLLACPCHWCPSPLYPQTAAVSADSPVSAACTSHPSGMMVWTPCTHGWP